MSGANGGLNVSIGGNTISHLIPLTLRVSHTPAIEIGSCFFSIFVSGKRACEDIQLVVAMCVDARYFIRRRFVFVQSSTSGGQQRRWNVLPLNFSNLRSYETEGNEIVRGGKRKSFERRKARSKHFGTLQNRFISRLRRVSRSWRTIRAWCN